MRKLIFFLLTTILISCDPASRIGDAFGITAFCHPEIQYHLSSDCEDSSEITASEIVSVLDFNTTIDGIEVILNEAEIVEVTAIMGNHKLYCPKQISKLMFSSFKKEIKDKYGNDGLATKYIELEGKKAVN